jgi:hypothetical protein
MPKTSAARRKPKKQVALAGEIKQLIQDLKLEDESLPVEVRGAIPSEAPTGPIPVPIASNPPIPSTIMCPW